MRLPRADHVRVDERKVRAYLLSETHPVGRYKARIFAAIGFDANMAAAFVAVVRQIAAVGDVSKVHDNQFGRKYTVPGELKGPFGTLRVLTVWFQEAGHEDVRLVTIRPE